MNNENPTPQGVIPASPRVSFQHAFSWNPGMALKNGFQTEAFWNDNAAAFRNDKTKLSRCLHFAFYSGLCKA